MSCDSTGNGVPAPPQPPSQFKPWATTQPGTLALGTSAGGRTVSKMKVKRLEAAIGSPVMEESPAGNQPEALPKPAPTAPPQPTLAETLSRAGKYAEAAQATREFI